MRDKEAAKTFTRLSAYFTTDDTNRPPNAWKDIQVVDA